MGWTRQEVLDVARSTGMPVVEAWSSHNAGLMGTVVGPMLHHTGSDWSYPSLTAPTLRTVREGRSDLKNALCMYYISYDGTIYCITEKIAWHAGTGAWAAITDGNGHFSGIEAESDGKQWTKATVTSYKRLAAAILRKTGRTVAYAPRHADYALPKGRKTDFSGIDPATFLADVNAALTGTTPTEEPDLDADQNNRLTEAWQNSAAAKDNAAAAARIAQEAVNWVVDPDHGILKQLGTLSGQIAGLTVANGGADAADIKAAAEAAAAATVRELGARLSS